MSKLPSTEINFAEDRNARERRARRVKKALGMKSDDMARSAYTDRALAELGLSMEEINELSDIERALVLQSLEEMLETGTSLTAQSIWNADYKWVPCSAEEFITDNYYLGRQCRDMFDVHKKAMIEMFDERDRPPTEYIMGGSIGWGKCLAEYCLIPTDRGYVPIKDICVRLAAEPVSVISHKGVLRPVTQRHTIGKYPTLKIKTKYNYELEGRETHRIIVWDGDALVWRTFADLKVGDVAVLQRGTDLYGDAPLSEDEAYCIGLWTGDGHFTNVDTTANTNAVNVSVGLYEDAWLPVVKDALNVLSDNEVRVSKNKTCYRVSVSSVDVVRRWESYGVVSGSCYKVIPSQVLCASQRAQAAFIRGLFDTDGCVSANRIEYCTVSTQLAYQLQATLLNMGITVNRTRKKKTGAWILSVVGRRSRDNFARLIGFRHPRKSRLLEELQDTKYKTHRSNDRDVLVNVVSALRKAGVPVAASTDNLQRATFERYADRCGDDALQQIVDRDLLLLPVMSVDESEAMCYDLSVEEDESYAAFGFLSHNTTLSAVILTYLLYRLSCLNNPHEYFKLMEGAHIALAIYSVSKTQAEDSAFSKIRSWVDSSPYFLDKYPRIQRIKSKLVFERGAVQVITGSREIHSIGRDVYAFLLDEANFMQGKNSRDDGDAVAQKIYTNAKRRLQSRFLDNPGMVILSSSKTTHASFLERHVENSRKDIENGETRLDEYTQWDVRPEIYAHQKKFKVEIGDRVFPSRILAPDDDPRPGADVISVPEGFRRAFEKDLEASIRDIAGRATYNMCALFSDARCIEECRTDEWEHPFTREVLSLSTQDDVQLSDFFLPEKMFSIQSSRYIPRNAPAQVRFIHVDIGLTGDCAGIACSHMRGFKTAKRPRPDGTFYEERVPMVGIDFMLQIKPPIGAQIDLSKIRAFLISLRDMGLPIWRVTCDGYQSADFLQTMEKLSFNCAILSVDRNDVPYMNLKQGMQEKRVSYYRYDPFEQEVSELERNIEQRKVDHPKISPSTGAPGSKDVADAVCGSVQNAMTNQDVQVGIDLPVGETRTDKPVVSTAVGAISWDEVDKELRNA